MFWQLVSLGNAARPGPGSEYNGSTPTTNANYVEPSARMGFAYNVYYVKFNT